MRAVSAVFAALALLGLTANAGRAAPDFRATAHKIAVLSLLGDTLDGGPNGSSRADGAGFDDLAERAIRAQIGTDLPGASVVRVEGPRLPLLERLYNTVGFGDVGMTAVRDDLHDWARVHSVDYIVVLRRTIGILEYRSAGYSMTEHRTYFGIGVHAARTMAFLNLTVCDGKTLDVVSQMSVRDLDWGSMRYDGHDPTQAHLPVLIDDTKAMLSTVVPALSHGAGL